MVRDNRIKTISFPAGSLVADAAGLFDVYTHYPPNGTIQKIEFKGGNYTATGSMLLSVSGTGETLLNFSSGTDQGNLADGTIVYPHVFTFDVNSVTGSPNIASQRVINDLVRLVGSGLGNGKSGLGVNVVYI